MSKADGFVYDGTIYINKSRNSIEAPLHEMMHFVCALMKSSPDQTIRTQYYEWLDLIGQWIDGSVRGTRDTTAGSLLNESSLNKLLGEPLKEALLRRASRKYNPENPYDTKHLSDIKEEVLVTLLGHMFKNNVEIAWGESKRITPEFVQRHVKKTLESVFKNKMNTDNSGVELDSDTSLQDILRIMRSELLGADSTLLKMAMNESQEIADIKNFLIRNGLIELSEECL